MKINNYNKLLYFFLSLTLFIDLYFNIDTAGSGGYIIDFNSTWPLVENPLSYKTNLDFKFPLHYYIAAAIYKLVNNKELLRFIYCLLALPIPYLFFLSLSIKFKKIDLNNLFLFSLIIFLLPSFRSAAVWPNTQITGIFFFLVSEQAYQRTSGGSSGFFLDDQEPRPGFYSCLSLGQPRR